MAEPKTAPRPLTWEAVDLTPFLRDVLGNESLEVVEPRRLGGGASKDLWTFVVRAPGEPESVTRRFVLRRSAPELSNASLSLESEFHVTRAAYEAGVLMPEPLWLSRDADGNVFYVMEHREGETLVPRLHRMEEFAEARRALPAQLGRALAPIHKIAPTPELEKVLGAARRENPARAQLQQFRSILPAVATGPHPVFELTFRYLEQRLPEEVEITLVHGDYRLGNVMFGPEGLRGILDWELAHWGDPHEDLAWPMVRAWRFGRDDLPLGGIGSRDDYLAAYEEAAGRQVDRDRLRWWEIFGNLRWGIITLIQSSHFLHGRTRSLEKAVIGRRASEVEAELLSLLSS